MAAVLVCCALAVLVGAVAWRPHGMGPTAGAAAAVVLVLIGGAASVADIGDALRAQWRAYVTLIAIMTMTSAADRMGLLTRIAALIEPRTRGPVRHAFRLTFVLSAVVAAVLSNDAAVLLMTPTVIALLRTVYPKRHARFTGPFVLAVFASAGVAPFVISNPMNLIVADHIGIGFNEYSLTMVPVAIAGWVVAYAVLAWMFRDVLADDDPARGGGPVEQPSLPPQARIVVAALVAELVAYPVMSYLDVPLWPIAAAGGVVCVLASLAAGHRVGSLVGGVAWPIFPFLIGVFVLAKALEHVGVVDALYHLYTTTPAPLATIGGVSALGSAVLNNQPMSVLNVFTLERMADNHTYTFAALIGGDLGPRLLPIGSLASLLWYDTLRKHDVPVAVTTFVRVGLALTLPTLAVSLGILALLGRV